MKGIMSRFLGTKAGRPIVVGPPRPQVIGPAPSTRVVAPARFAWDERRWIIHRRANCIEYRGKYRVYHICARVWREFDGAVIHQGQIISAYIANPPVEMRRHRHGICLQLTTNPWFRIHWARPPKSVDDALLFMERMLHESFNGER